MGCACLKVVQLVFQATYIVENAHIRSRDYFRKAFGCKGSCYATGPVHNGWE